MIEARKSPKDILSACFPSLSERLAISGGWGRTQDDACCIDCEGGFSSDFEKDASAWETINIFVEKRIYFDLIISRPTGEKFSGISWNIQSRETIYKNGRIQELIVYTVLAFSDTDWEILKSEWEGPNGYSSAEFDIKGHLLRRTTLQKKFEFNYWFDVTKCYSASLFDVFLPWFLSGFYRGKFVNYETKLPGLGYSVSYHGIAYPTPAEATIYFYTRRDANIPAGCNDQKIIDELRSAIDDVMIANRSKFGAECKIVRIAKYRPRDEGEEFLFADFDVVTPEHGPKKSLIFLRGHAGLYLKIRISLSSDEKFRELPFSFVEGLSNFIFYPPQQNLS
jgi:hypothetical protein